MERQYSSLLLDKAVGEFAKLPGIGRKTALRLVLHLLKQPDADVASFTDAITTMKRDVRYCRVCHNVSDSELCPICADNRRDSSLVCVVENIRDVMAIENTMQYHGLYHVLGGILSPMDGIGPADIEIDSLVSRVAEGGVTEVILALSPTMEGDTTNFYISRRLRGYDVRLSVIARGIAVGNELEYADEVTLGRSILKRTPFEI
ncbi:MAG: recombination mediator RecR [Prevotella sp.]|nr:recombination mediator RecR [Prevotella sp.]MCI7342252.1 recombination mediator RecR [Prevotella sp.]